MYTVSDKLISEFSELYQETTGKRIDFQEAKKSANLAVEIYSILLGIEDA